MFLGNFFPGFEFPTGFRKLLQLDLPFPLLTWLPIESPSGLIWAETRNLSNFFIAVLILSAFIS